MKLKKREFDYLSTTIFDYTIEVKNSLKYEKTKWQNKALYYNIKRLSDKLINKNINSENRTKLNVIEMSIIYNCLHLRKRNIEEYKKTASESGIICADTDIQMIQKILYKLRRVKIDGKNI